MEALISRIVDAGFQFDLDADVPKLVKARKAAVMPPALLEEVRVNRGELLAFLRAAERECAAPDSDPEPESCRLCSADVSDPDLRARLTDPLFCDRGGAKEVRAKLTGELLHPAEGRCPYKPAVRKGR